MSRSDFFSLSVCSQKELFIGGAVNVFSGVPASDDRGTVRTYINKHARTNPFQWPDSIQLYNMLSSYILGEQAMGYTVLILDTLCGVMSPDLPM